MEGHSVPLEQDITEDVISLGLDSGGIEEAEMLFGRQVSVAFSVVLVTRERGEDCCSLRDESQEHQAAVPTAATSSCGGTSLTRRLFDITSKLSLHSPFHATSKTWLSRVK